MFHFETWSHRDPKLLHWPIDEARISPCSVSETGEAAAPEKTFTPLTKLPMSTMKRHSSLLRVGHKQLCNWGNHSHAPRLNPASWHTPALWALVPPLRQRLPTFTCRGLRPESFHAPKALQTSTPRALFFLLWDTSLQINEKEGHKNINKPPSLSWNLMNQGWKRPSTTTNKP